jgi:hypothetical protein
MSVMIKITQKIPSLPSQLETPSGRRFKIIHIDGEKVIVVTGKKPTRIKIPASALEDVPNFLEGKGWVRIGAIHGISDEASLDGFLKEFTYGTSIASYVAPILELAGIIEIDRRRPARIRLKTSI